MLSNINSSTRYIIFDIETTGLSPRRGDRVIEIGAVALQTGNNVGEYHSLINIGRRIPRPAVRVHGITEEMLIGRPTPEEAFPKFHAFINEGVLVAHNAPFDVAFLRYEFGRIGLGLSNGYRCTLDMSRRRFPCLREHTLEAVYRHLFGTAQIEAQKHRALEDARMVARIWVEMMSGNR